VFDAVTAGATTRAAVRRKVDFPNDVVDAVLDHLIRTGRVFAQPPTLDCASTSCGGCPLATGERCQSLPVSTVTGQP
jgi:hypothetical protein